MGYMHMYAPPKPTEPSGVYVRAGLYLGTLNLIMQTKGIDMASMDSIQLTSEDLCRGSIGTAQGAPR